MNEIAEKLVSKWLSSCKSNKIPVLVILGPTASGKTSLSVGIAKKFKGEIISADSRQVYKGMDIGTDKITEKEMQGVPHHLLDVAEPSENFTLAHYIDHTEKAIQESSKRGNLPMIVGGTGLYINAVIQKYDLPRIPPNPKLREKYENIAKEKGLEAVHEHLKSIDSDNAAKIHPNNLRYVIRAIEIFEAGKQPKNNQKQEESPYEVLKIGIRRPREQLYERINSRVDTQVDRGILEELDRLLKICPRSANSMSSLGYKEYFPYLDGKKELKDCVETLKKNTRNYAKRQLTWFRKDETIQWIDA